LKLDLLWPDRLKNSIGASFLNQPTQDIHCQDEEQGQEGITLANSSEMLDRWSLLSV
jgi:hypothetical protein